MTTEGIVKYRLEFSDGPAPDATGTGALRAWQLICRRLELVGRDPARYGGCAYGNLSRRIARRRFVISGTQTAGHARPAPGDYTLVTEWSITDNRVNAEGPCRPSSESLTHAALYERDPAIHFVIHVHSPEIWHAAAALGLPATDPDVPYGTPAMAEEVWRLFDHGDLGPAGVFAMGGHEDGVVAYGNDAASAGLPLIGLLAQALQHRGAEANVRR
ncbi:MAG: class II aldolase/adducin family protein [Gammaproteobacteria bacterium]|jgi:hypothetical protein